MPPSLKGTTRCRYKTDFVYLFVLWTVFQVCTTTLPLANKSVLPDPQLERITATEKEKVIAEKLNIDG